MVLNSKLVMERRKDLLLTPYSANHNCSRQHFDFIYVYFRENKV